MTGLSALQVLADEGHQVSVFEKSRGSGGRMATKKAGEASWDMGAQFIRSHTTRFESQIELWQQQKWIAEWPVQPHHIDKEGCQPSSDDITRYVAVPRMTALTRHMLACAHNFHSSTRVIECQRHKEGWYLTSEEQQTFGPFGALLITTPPEQAKPLLAENQQLAEHCDVAMLPCWTLLLAFAHPLNTAVQAAFVKDSPISWIANNSSKPQRDNAAQGQLDGWVIQANHRWSQEHQDAPREKVQEELQEAFFNALELTPQQPSEHWLHRWLYALPDNPVATTNVFVNTPGVLMDADQKLLVSGDWIATPELVEKGKHSPSIENAWLNGQDAGKQLLALLKPAS